MRRSRTFGSTALGAPPQARRRIIIRAARLPTTLRQAHNSPDAQLYILQKFGLEACYDVSLRQRLTARDNLIPQARQVRGTAATQK